MLSSFDLRPGEDESRFRAAYDLFVAKLRAAGLIIGAGPVGRRVADTPMDTDDGREQQYFTTLDFRDRAQLDAAYAHIQRSLRPATASHLQMHRRITNSVFLCWEEAPVPRPATQPRRSMKMTDTPAIIRFEPHGPADTGLVEWDRIDPADLVSGEPVQRGHIYHEQPDAGYLAGVWDCTAQTEHMAPYPVDELMILLEGSLVMGLPDGKDVELTEGDAFIIPKGFECQWKQDGYLRKVFMILDGPVPATGNNPSLHRITVPDLAPRETGEEVATQRLDFVNATGSMQVGVAHWAATTLPAAPVTENRLIHVLEGRLTLSADGAEQVFGAGETAYLPAGHTVGWQTQAGTRLLVANCTPTG
ncbi:DUF6614 family protein [Roseovarius salis]|uniref:DUF6614 family protein n=1 Tax=Roseovarius salis TaxID=3376063 RepID=UPI0037CC85F4